jgi:hypothetical protein
MEGLGRVATRLHDGCTAECKLSLPIDQQGDEPLGAATARGCIEARCVVVVALCSGIPLSWEVGLRDDVVGSHAPMLVGRATSGEREGGNFAVIGQETVAAGIRRQKNDGRRKTRGTKIWGVGISRPNVGGERQTTAYTLLPKRHKLARRCLSARPTG